MVRLIDRHCGKHPISNTLTATELRAVEIRLIKLIQQEFYYSEMQQLARGKTLQSNSTLLPLQPFIDSIGVLRVGGRLENSCLVQKHPAILPRSHPPVEQLLIQVHLDNKHAGNTNMLGLISQDLYICGVKRLLRKILHNCITCRKEYAVRLQQKMGQLPCERVQPTSPFHSTGIDMAGPFSCKKNSTHNSKAWACLFVCLAT